MSKKGKMLEKPVNGGTLRVTIGDAINGSGEGLKQIPEDPTTAARKALNTILKTKEGELETADKKQEALKALQKALKAKGKTAKIGHLLTAAAADPNALPGWDLTPLSALAKYIAASPEANMVILETAIEDEKTSESLESKLKLGEGGLPKVLAIIDSALIQLQEQSEAIVTGLKQLKGSRTEIQHAVKGTRDKLERLLGPQAAPPAPLSKPGKPDQAPPPAKPAVTKTPERPVAKPEDITRAVDKLKNIVTPEQVAELVTGGLADLKAMVPEGIPVDAEHVKAIPAPIWAHMVLAPRVKVESAKLATKGKSASKAPPAKAEATTTFTTLPERKSNVHRLPDLPTVNGRYPWEESAGTEQLRTAGYTDIDALHTLARLAEIHRRVEKTYGAKNKAESMGALRDQCTTATKEQTDKAKSQLTKLELPAKEQTTIIEHYSIMYKAGSETVAVPDRARIAQFVTVYRLLETNSDRRVKGVGLITHAQAVVQLEMTTPGITAALNSLISQRTKPESKDGKAKTLNLDIHGLETLVAEAGKHASLEQHAGEILDAMEDSKHPVYVVLRTHSKWGVYGVAERQAKKGKRKLCDLKLLAGENITSDERQRIEGLAYPADEAGIAQLVRDIGTDATVLDETTLKRLRRKTGRVEAPAPEAPAKKPE